MTFLFTDIEGSTALWEHDDTSMRMSLAEHDRQLLSAIRTHGGYMFASGGDGFAAAFSDASAALHAALDAQAALALPVRMSLHTGTAEERDGNYYGRTLNRCARIMAAGHGGQILLSDATAALVRDTTRLTDLGEHQLTGLAAILRLWQVGVEHHPALRTAESRHGNLEVPLDSFIGRTHELDTLIGLIDTHRLVTIVGVGGIGKTRIVLEAVDIAGSDRTGGVWFVDLARARSDEAVIDEVAATLGVQPAQGQTIDDRVVEYLESRATLVVFDNCEHVMRASASVIERLVKACPGLRVVATSREALMLRGEHVMPLGPMSTGDDAGGSGDAVALFVERARAERHTFEPDDHELEAIGELCRRLDGMPLAIELAAARARTLGTRGVLERLDERLRLLSGGWRTGIGRQQTLQATLDWSYALLDAHEQAVFDRLGVIVGSFTIDDAVTICSTDGLGDLDVVDAMSGIVDKSMCATDTTGNTARYRYLETMRAYARTHLDHAGTLAEYSTRHCNHFAGRAIGAALTFTGPDEVAVVDEIERIMPDLRAAFLWAADHDNAEALRYLAILSGAWSMRGSREVGRWFYDARDQLDGSSAANAAALGYVFLALGDNGEARRLAERLIDEGDPETLGGAWTNLGWTHVMDGDFEAAVICQEHHYELSKADDSVFAQVFGGWPLAVALNLAGRDPGELPRQVLERATAAGWPTGIALGWYAVAIAHEDSEPLLTLADFERAMTAAKAARNPWAQALIRRDRIENQMLVLPATEFAGEMIDLIHDLDAMGSKLDLVNTMHRASEVLHAAGQIEPAATIFGWLNGRAFRTEIAAVALAEAMAASAARYGPDWDQLLDTGRGMTLEQVTELACDALAGIT